MENEIKWEVVEELSDENGTPNCWAHKLGPADYVYITHNYRKTFDVERSAPCSDSGIATRNLDGCHKIYLIEDQEDEQKSHECGYKILDISQLMKTYEYSCELRFIRNWKNAFSNFNRH